MLGRKGCRFRPDGDDCFRRQEAQAPCINAQVAAGKLALPACLDGLSNSFAVVFFHELLSITQLKRPFDLSKTTPMRVPKTTSKMKQTPRKKAKTPTKQRPRPPNAA